MSWDDADYDHIRIWGRYLPQELTSAAEGRQGSRQKRHLQALPMLTHEFAAMYLIGVVAQLEGLYEAAAWRGEGVIPGLGAIDGIDEVQFEAAKKMRDALVHNARDLSSNNLGSQPSEDEKVLIRGLDGVTVDETDDRFVVTFSIEFIETARHMFLALTQHRDNWRDAST